MEDLSLSFFICESCIKWETEWDAEPLLFRQGARNVLYFSKVDFLNFLLEYYLVRRWQTEPFFQLLFFTLLLDF